MMDEFKQSFFEDARDLLKQLEQAILTLETNPEDPDIIEEIFRVMHTIKGAANMFGFELIGEFTHDIETIYDAIRSKDAFVDESILDMTFQSVDHIHVLLDDPQLSDKENLTSHKKLRNLVSNIIISVEEGQKKEKSEPLLIMEQDGQSEDNATYYLLIRPKEQLAKDSGHPIFFVIDDLKEQGECKLTPHINKDSADILYWDMYLSTDKDEEGIKNVFIFVEDDCDLEIFKLADFNLLKEAAFVKKAEEFSQEDVQVDINQIQEYVEQLLDQIRKSQVAKIIEEESKQGSNSGINQSSAQSGSIRVSTDKIGQLMNWVSELVTMQATLQSIASIHKHPQLHSAAEHMEVIANNLRDTVFSISLLPLDSISVKLKRLIRNLSKDLNKNVEFKTEGADTELDKNVIEALTDPLMHILRNSMDHGLETTEERAATDKSGQGYILLKAYYSGANVFIEIHDDGRGIDPDKILAKAIEKNLIDEKADLSKEEIYHLLFMPGFSTASEVTDVSGRGVGMDVVRKKIREIRGEIHISSELGQGTSIIIRLPLTLSIMDGLLTQVDNTHFVFPLSLVSRIDKVPFEEVNKEGQFSKSLVVEGEQMSVLSLRDTFGMHDNYPEYATIVSIHDGNRTKGIVVDKVKGELQAVLKPLGNMYEDQDYISGSTILGDGNLALVLDTNKLISRYASQPVALDQ